MAKNKRYTVTIIEHTTETTPIRVSASEPAQVIDVDREIFKQSKTTLNLNTVIKAINDIR